jgi:hypothetical protein
MAYLYGDAAQMKCAASPGGTFELILDLVVVPVNEVHVAGTPQTCRSFLPEGTLAGENEDAMHIRQTPTLARESRHIVVL